MKAGTMVFLIFSLLASGVLIADVRDAAAACSALSYCPAATCGNMPRTCCDEMGNLSGNVVYKPAPVSLSWQRSGYGYGYGYGSGANDPPPTIATCDSVPLSGLIDTVLASASLNSNGSGSIADAAALVGQGASITEAGNSGGTPHVAPSLAGSPGNAAAGDSGLIIPPVSATPRGAGVTDKPQSGSSGVGSRSNGSVGMGAGTAAGPGLLAQATTKAAPSASTDSRTAAAAVEAAASYAGGSAGVGSGRSDSTGARTEVEAPGGPSVVSYGKSAAPAAVIAGAESQAAKHSDANIDDEDYFKRTTSRDSLFRLVERRYGNCVRQWSLDNPPPSRR